MTTRSEQESIPTITSPPRSTSQSPKKCITSIADPPGALQGDCGNCHFHTVGSNLSLNYEQEILGDIRPDDSDLFSRIITSESIEAYT